MRTLLAVIVATCGCDMFPGEDCALRSACEPIADAIDASTIDALDSSDARDEPIDCELRGEDCTDGIDDNCDGRADCEDPLCQIDHECVTPAPSGWSGPDDLYEATGNPAPAPPPCSNGWVSAVDGHTDLSAPKAQCGCTCGAASGQTCGSLVAAIYTDSTCTTKCTSITLAPNMCASYTGCSSEYVAVPSLAPSGGSCSPIASKTIPPATWSRVGRACAWVGSNHAGCVNGELCVAKPQAPFGAALCIHAAGDLACPNGPYSQKHLYWATTSDTRDCTVCSCGAASGGSCDAAGHVYTFGSCSGSAVAWQSPQSCKLVGGYYAGINAGGTMVTPGSCSPSASTPLGDVTPIAPTTVCCTP